MEKSLRKIIGLRKPFRIDSFIPVIFPIPLRYSFILLFEILGNALSVFVPLYLSKIAFEYLFSSILSPSVVFCVTMFIQSSFTSLFFKFTASEYRNEENQQKTSKNINTFYVQFNLCPVIATFYAMAITTFFYTLYLA